MNRDAASDAAAVAAVDGHASAAARVPGDATGLSRAEAALRLQRDGPNELSPPRRRTWGRIALEVAAEPMFQLLLAAALIYLLLGDIGEASMLLAFVAMIAVITLVQEHRTERVLEALRDLTSPRALVLRDGRAERIAGRDVVQGDLLLLTEGDRVAADARLLSANDLKADESLLTGEALPVAKSAPPGAAPVGAAAPRPGSAGGEGFVFAGTMVVDGQGQARVLATGVRSEIGRIGKALDAVASPPTPLQVQTRRLVRIFSVLGLGLSALLVLLYGLTRGDWLAGLLAGITLAMSMLPQEFLLILTVFMAMGAWRISRQRVLTRRAATIEALGAATVLCSDKTGTLTHNRMAIAELARVPEQGEPMAWRAGEGALPPALQPLLEFGILASERDPFDAMELAFHTLGGEQLPALRRHADWTLEHEYGLAPALMAMTHVWRAPGAAACTVAVKGAPEAVAALCHLPAARQQATAAAAQAMAERGHRVLAVARAPWPGKEWPATPHGFDFDWLGLVALADPLREGVPAAVQQCRDAGIRVVMITGDHPATARAIAAQAGLATGGDVLGGPELAALGEAELRRRVASANVFARVLPEQKLRIVEALKANGEVVAMTGDGVNDAPSLKAAHIGIAMGGRGTDVAREASSLVLLDDDFASIVQAVRLGRRTYDNLRKAMAFVFAVHVPIAGLSLMPLLFGLPLVFTPVHIAFLELVIDPVCSIAFEAESDEADVMARPPRDPAAPLFSLGLVGWSLAQGALLLAAVAAFFVGLLQAQVPEAQARAAAFTALVACNAVLIVVNRSFNASLLGALRRPNPLLWAMLAATAVLLAAALAVPPLRRLFLFAPLSPSLLAAALSLALVVWLALAALKRIGRPRSSRRAA
jgi:P-type Ca2+ transporter type 2C